MWRVPPPHPRSHIRYRRKAALTPPLQRLSHLGVDGVHERDQSAVAIRRGQSHRAQPRRSPQRGLQRVVLRRTDVVRRLCEQQQPVPEGGKGGDL